MEAECVYPDYLQRTTRSLPITGGMRIPEGTKLTIHANSTKPLAEVRVHTSHDPHDTSLPLAGPHAEAVKWDYGMLEADDVLTIQVTDADGVTSREPYRVSLSVVPDELPQVAVRLAGIGTAITPDAVLPFVGKISDDYGLGTGLVWRIRLATERRMSGRSASSRKVRRRFQRSTASICGPAVTLRAERPCI